MPKPLEDMIKRKASPRIIQKVVKEPDVSVRTEVRPPERFSKSEYSSESPKASVGRRSIYMLWTVAAFSAAFLLIGLSFMWGKATAEVFPIMKTFALNDNFTADKTATGGGLGFELMVIHGEESKVLEATEEKELTQRASGIAAIFNDYSVTSQRLDLDTRLSGSNGKIYKTKTQVTVPGQKADGSAGTVEVGIYAAEAGEDYNSGPLDFEIIGFKGTPKAQGFKVRSKTGTEITGGFKGKTLVASTAEQESAAGELKVALEEELFKKASDQIPEGFVLFKDATVFTEDKIHLPLGTEELVVTLNGTLYGLLFREDALTRQIAVKKAGSSSDEDVFIPNFGALKFTLGNIGDVSLEAMNTISFNLSGSVDLVWKLDTEKFIGDLLGRPKKDFSSILSAYKNIDRAELA
ncbi:MAG: hypothetical protein M3M85_02190, partial [bacterium]|nr:hypothetical protein [bacterium]